MALWLAVGAALAPASHPEFVPAAAPGLIETGVPAFVVLSPETMGLSTAPTDLRQMPDGRILLVARDEIAFGDGVRWEVYRRSPATAPINLLGVAVDRDGSIYAGVPGGFARVGFGEDGCWHLTTVASLPEEENPLRPHVSSVFDVGGEWYWHSGSGAILAWRPGRPSRIAGRINSHPRAFTVRDRVFFSSGADGALYRADPAGFVAVIAPESTTPANTITAGVPRDPEWSFVGTNNSGLKLFDGVTLQPYLDQGPLGPGRRINDLCAVGEGLFAAAVDNLGIVFFDRDGRAVEVLDRSLDLRLSRVHRLVHTPEGQLWALLNEGVARMEFPSRVSHYEPLVTTGLTYCQPVRHKGRLWLLADGRAQRAVYDGSLRLVGFENFSPPGEFVFSLTDVDDVLMASTEKGIWELRAAGWVPAVEGLVNAVIATPDPARRRWLFCARDEIGWLQSADGRWLVERFPQPGLGETYGSILDNDGSCWVELGGSRVAQVVLGEHPLRASVYTEANGLPGGWVQAFNFGDGVRFNVANRVFRFARGSGRFVEDTELTSRFPEFAGLVGRVSRDPAGRLWFSAGGAVQVLDPGAPPSAKRVETIRPGLLPTRFHVEAGGVVWMSQLHRLARYDPTLPPPPSIPPRALISRVHLTASNRTLVDIGDEMPPLAFSDNSIAVSFLTPRVQSGLTTTFQVMLEGARRESVSVGVSGSAVFNRLKEGRYRLRVQPLFNGRPGDEDSVAFTIRPPWFRTPLAYAGFGFIGFGSVGLIVRLSVMRSRREKERLERMVAMRTQDLNRANARLASQVDETVAKAAALQASDDRYRRLSSELERRVADRTVELHQANEQLLASNRELESFSYSVSHDLRAPLRNISGFADLLRSRAGAALDAESARFLGIVSVEAARLGRLIDSLLNVSRLSRAELVRQTLDLTRLLDAARGEIATDLGRRRVEWRIAPLPPVEGDAALVRQVLVNLLANAAKFTRQRDPAVIEIGCRPAAQAGGQHTFFVRDNGAGFDPKYADKLFGVFQRLHSAKEFEGTGVGLANVRRIVSRHGGRVWAEGAPGAGATFYFTLPAAPAPTPTG